ncbi:hypothetical protein [Halalkalibacter alkalisediminis]|uniref:Uncharacterized protein n=1 Tax=Halalkalibacter alkalisediminis TaxID=935616 RepID=A0ABV6NHX6_9BACI|nr:hypothetical protein [Halalkalibacter alkalisediminis]
MSRNVDVEKRNVETKNDVSKVASTFIKYTAYLIMFFGFLWFLVQFIFPLFQ